MVKCILWTTKKQSFARFPIVIPIETEKKYPRGKDRPKSENKNSSEICGGIVIRWEHADL